MSALSPSKEYLLQNDVPFPRQWVQSYTRNHGKPLKRVFIAQRRHTLSTVLSCEFSTMDMRFCLPSSDRQCLPQNGLQSEKISMRRTYPSIPSLQNRQDALQKCYAKWNLDLPSSSPPLTPSLSCRSGHSLSFLPILFRLFSCFSSL